MLTGNQCTIPQTILPCKLCVQSDLMIEYTNHIFHVITNKRTRVDLR